MTEKFTFEELVREISGTLPEFPRTMAGRQMHINCSARSLHIINSYFDLFRKHFKSVNEADALAIAAKYFMENVKEDEVDEE